MIKHLSLLSCACLALASLASAQTRIYTFDGDSAGDRLGRAVHGAGDVDGDGIPDLIVGAPEDDDNGSESGSARVVSGADGRVLFTFRGAAANQRLGGSVSGAGDVNGDGVPDLIVGAIGVDNGSFAFGEVQVLSGAGGSPLFKFSGTVPFVFFGYAVRAAGDVDADGYDDLLIGAPALFNTGNAVVLSGRDGTRLRQFLVFGLGEVVDTAGDVDGDGFADVIVGRPEDVSNGISSGSVVVYSGRTGDRLWQAIGAPGDQLGTSVCGVGDVDGDGLDDVVAGAIQFLNGGPGYALVLSGSDGTTLYTLTGAGVPDQFGTSVAGGGDLDGDGMPDIVVGAPSEDANGADSGAVHVFSGLTGAELATLIGDAAGDGLGTAVAMPGDVDGDGLAEVLVGAPEDDDNGPEAGRAFVYEFGGTGTPGRERIYGKACASSNGNMPRIDFRGDSALGARLQVRLRGAVPSASAVLNIGDPVQIPLDIYGLPGCTAYADPLGFNISSGTDVDGLARETIPVPNVPALTGVRFDMQWVVLDPGANATGVVFSNALAVTFGG